MIKRYGDAVSPGKTYRRRPGVYAILLRDGEILTTHQSDPNPEFQLPGGGIDPGEHPIAALHREVMEETGWHIANLRRLGAFRRFAYMPEYDLWAEKLCTVEEVTCSDSGSCGWKAEPQAEWSCTIIGSMRPGDCASITCMSERWPRYSNERRAATRSIVEHPAIGAFTVRQAVETPVFRHQPVIDHEHASSGEP